MSTTKKLSEKPRPSDVKSLQKRIASAVTSAIKRTKHGYGQPKSTAKIGIVSRAAALAALAANSSKSFVVKKSKQTYTLGGKLGKPKRIHKALGLSQTEPIRLGPGKFTGSMYVQQLPNGDYDFPAWVHDPPVHVTAAEIVFRGENEMTIKLRSRLGRKF